MISSDKLCMSCMRENGDARKCPHCGYYADSTQISPYLPVRTVVANRYMVGKMLEYNGEGATYIGWDLIEKKARPLRIQWEYTNENNDIIQFEQRVLDESGFAVDSESGYSKIKEIEECDVYYRKNSEQHFYVWNENKYSFCLISNLKISDDVLVEIINGIKK